NNITTLLPTETTYKSVHEEFLTSLEIDRVIYAIPVIAQLERDYYNQNTKLVREQENNDIAHYSFDWSQNIQIPYSSQQASQRYFITALKVYLFGIHNEATKEQINF
ncbi:2935_t:CDS:2, partial [Ambispora leptoticha]